MINPTRIEAIMLINVTFEVKAFEKNAKQIDTMADAYRKNQAKFFFALNLREQ